VPVVIGSPEWKNDPWRRLKGAIAWACEGDDDEADRLYRDIRAGVIRAATGLGPVELLEGRAPAGHVEAELAKLRSLEYVFDEAVVRVNIAVRLTTDGEWAKCNELVASVLEGAEAAQRGRAPGPVSWRERRSVYNALTVGLARLAGGPPPANGESVRECGCP
jgi:hypothetical protein